MKRFFMTVVAVSAIALLPTSVAHEQLKGEGFIGLWAGIAPVGFGQNVQVSIYDDGDGALAFSFSEDITAFCVAQGPEFRQQGRIGGPAAVSPDNMNALDLLANGFCFDMSKTPPTQVQALKDSPSRFELIERHRARWELLDPNVPPGVKIIFYRISR